MFSTITPAPTLTTIISTASTWTWTPPVILSTIAISLTVITAIILPTLNRYIEKRRRLEEKQLQEKKYLNLEREKMLDLRGRIRRLEGGEEILKGLDSDWIEAYRNDR